jgi:S1-C subfamily serine protease
MLYSSGTGVPKDETEAARWFRKAADQGKAAAQYFLGGMYAAGTGVPKDEAEAVRWNRKAADQGDASAQTDLGIAYAVGMGVPIDLVEAYKWFNLAAASKGFSGENARRLRDSVEFSLTPTQIAEGQQRAREWVARAETKKEAGPEQPGPERTGSSVLGTGTGFVVSAQGHILTAFHVVSRASSVRVHLPSGEAAAVEIVASDQNNDLALLKIRPVDIQAAAFREGRGPSLGEDVFAVGFPLYGYISTQLSATRGNISALAGPADDTRLLQITAPVQPGNSGGPLLDQAGNVVGMVVGKLDTFAVAKAIRDIPQNVNFALSGAVLRAFLESRGVDYRTRRSTSKLEPDEAVKQGRAFTVLVEVLQ